MTLDLDNSESFGAELKKLFSPSQAISDPNRLYGRETMLRQISRGFNAPGRQVFIFGDRGVGKTSLAQSAAVIHQASSDDPIIIGCDFQSNFQKLMQNIVQRAAHRARNSKQIEKISLSVPGLTVDWANKLQGGIAPEVETVNDAVIVLRAVNEIRNGKTVVVIDEFDRLRHEDDKKMFAELVKQLSDQDADVKIIFCGIGASLEELIGVHLSTDRQIMPIELKQIPFDARSKIIERAADELSLEIDKNIVIRIGQISDGFPYYIHLIGEFMMWAYYDDDAKSGIITADHFHDGLNLALEQAQTTLRMAYDKATLKYSNDYEEVLWAVADRKHFKSQISEIYEKSYLPIMQNRKGRSAMSKNSFYTRMYNLKNERHGSILTGNQAGWYQFRENVMRGYVRMRAQQSGTRLGVDLHGRRGEL